MVLGQSRRKDRETLGPGVGRHTKPSSPGGCPGTGNAPRGLGASPARRPPARGPRCRSGGGRGTGAHLGAEAGGGGQAQGVASRARERMNPALCGQPQGQGEARGEFWAQVQAQWGLLVRTVGRERLCGAARQRPDQGEATVGGGGRHMRTEGEAEADVGNSQAAQTLSCVSINVAPMTPRPLPQDGLCQAAASSWTLRAGAAGGRAREQATS